jgi:hypothetical protein
MDEAKIQLSQEEMDLVQNAQVLLTKQRIIGKVFNLFGEMADVLQKEMETVSLPSAVRQLSPKIARGENYELLPYVMLDYPRYFSREHVLAIRTFFWWGNFLSVTLQLKGKYLQQYSASIFIHRLQLADAGFHFAVSDDEWRHDHSSDHYTAMNILDADTIQQLLHRPFCKLSARIALSEWNYASVRFRDLYEVLTAVLKD